jgi:DNA mismatch repair ATPase MutS
MTGSCVCAEKFMISPVTVLTSMRIVDSLEENTSSFYAELKRLETIIKTVEQKENVFLLLDEILKGTNSNDRHIGSMALIKQLIKTDAVGIIATHDIALSGLSSEMPDNIENFNFDVQVENEELFFDYKLYKGVCKSLNASILMKKMGINI